VISRSNFGSGSSREMAVWAFAINGINVIIASNFARIFRENAFNDGILAIDLDPKIIDALFTEFKNVKDLTIDVDLEKLVLILKTKKVIKEIPFQLSPFQRDVIKSGSWVELAAKKY
jgi:3-isopropylmalate/(R)-2-methylmalate dehydratase small subunit